MRSVGHFYFQKSFACYMLSKNIRGDRFYVAVIRGLLGCLIRPG